MRPRRAWSDFWAWSRVSFSLAGSSAFFASSICLLSLSMAAKVSSHWFRHSCIMRCIPCIDIPGMPCIDILPGGWSDSAGGWAAKARNAALITIASLLLLAMLVLLNLVSAPPMEGLKKKASEMSAANDMPVRSLWPICCTASILLVGKRLFDRYFVRVPSPCGAEEDPRNDILPLSAEARPYPSVAPGRPCKLGLIPDNAGKQGPFGPK